MLRVHKIRLQPNAEQAQHLARACGTARFAWNWALAEWTQQYEACKLDPTLPKPNEGALRRQLNAIKREQFPWMLEVTKCAPQEAIRALGTAYKNWFTSLSGKRKGPRIQAPKFKKKGQRDSFKFDEKFAVDGCRIRIPNLGWVRMRESLRFPGALKGATVSRTAHAWYVAILVETDVLPARTESQGAVGIDLGLRTWVVASSGQETASPKALQTLLPRLKRLSRAHSRKQKGSANRRKSAQKLARLHWRIANVRQDAIHQLTNRLTRENSWVAIEDLNVKGMMAGRSARSQADAAFGEIRRQLTYKAAQRGVQLVVVDRWYPSSKTCHDCGHVHAELPRGASQWTCPACGVAHDRDLNAAKNILAESIRIMAPGAGVSACNSPLRSDCDVESREGFLRREEGSGDARKRVVKPALLKQEEIKHNLTNRPSYA